MVNGGSHAIPSGEAVAGGGAMKKSHKARRLFYRSGLTADELDQLIAQIGLRQVLAALDRVAGPAN
jgi:hypothetical protein